MPERIIIPSKPEACELCQRTGVPLTRHHLIPKSLHNKKWVRKRFDRTTRITATAWLCRPCHHHIHAQLNEKQMADYYFSIARLLEVPSIARFCQWLASKPPGFKPHQRR